MCLQSRYAARALSHCSWLCRLLAHFGTRLHARQLLTDFFMCLGLCHTVLPESKNKKNGKVNLEAAASEDTASTQTTAEDDEDLIYQAASPDEAALVLAAKCLGFKFLWRSTDEIAISVFGEKQVYTLLATNEFTSSRKRMSVLLQRPDRSRVLFCKGADNVILPNLVPPTTRCASDCWPFVVPHLGAVRLRLLGARLQGERCCHRRGHGY
jgi:magnesium-transporting ATPase (P-type)